MQGSTRWRLAGMMVLIYSVQGAFWPLLAVHLRDLGIGGRGRGWIFATLALGSLAMPLGVGRLVDRTMAAERFLALAYLVGAAILSVLAWGASTTSGPLFAWFFLYWLVTAPTGGIGATIAFRNLERPREEFGGVRLWGTVGWMVVGWSVSLVLAGSGPGSMRSGHGVYEAFWVAAGLSLLLSAYALTLPHTPPVATVPRPGETDRGLGSAFELLDQRDVAVFLRTAFGVCLTTPFLYQVLPPHLESRGLPRPWISTALTLGQIPEIAGLAVLPWMFRRFRLRGTLALGIAAYGVRFATLALDPPLWVVLAGIPLQGVGVACFTIGGQVYMDGRAAADRRASAQALLVVTTAGVGSLAGSLLAGEILTWFAKDSALVFLIPCIIDIALLIYFGAQFQPDGETTTQVDDDVDVVRPSNDELSAVRSHARTN